MYSIVYHTGFLDDDGAVTMVTQYAGIPHLPIVVVWSTLPSVVITLSLYGGTTL